jgi:hypothetical protein
MPTSSSSPDDPYAAAIQQGRAAVRLIEAIEVLATTANEQEVNELRVLQHRYRQRLLQLVAELPPEISAQILLASDQIQGPGGDVTLN